VLCANRDEGAPTQDGGKPPLTEDDIETNWDECIETFDAMELREELLRGIYAYGFEKPSAIQQVGCEAASKGGRNLIFALLRFPSAIEERYLLPAASWASSLESKGEGPGGSRDGGREGCGRRSGLESFPERGIRKLQSAGREFFLKAERETRPYFRHLISNG